MTRDSKAYFAYCGLYCKMCSLVATMPPLAKQLHESMKDDGWEHYGTDVFPEFEAFWSVLQKISKLDETSPLCQGGCGDPDCQMRVCAVAKGLEACAFCDEYPCKHMEELYSCYPYIHKNNARIKEIGLDAWLVEQDELAAQGMTNRILCKS